VGELPDPIEGDTALRPRSILFCADALTPSKSSVDEGLVSAFSRRVPAKVPDRTNTGRSPVPREPIFIPQNRTLGTGDVPPRSRGILTLSDMAAARFG
jgi:hypothetical protein